MRLGATLYVPSFDPDEIASSYAELGYSAATFPFITEAIAKAAAARGYHVEPTTPASISDDMIRLNRKAYARYDVMLAEVGAWKNMMDPDPEKRAKNLQHNVDALALADRVGAKCAVNIAGSFSQTWWQGAHPKNLSEEAFELTVQNVRHIIDSVKPRRAKYAIEMMQWVIPDSVDSYLDLIKAVDREAFAVHLDPVNLVKSPAIYYDTPELIRDCIDRLGPWIVSCHAKDIILADKNTVHLDEIRPGLGTLDYGVYLRELSKLPGDIPLLIEHLTPKQYPAARDYIVGVAAEVGVSFHQPKSVA
jgi:sugar phosphate isomerase/epimerase